MVQFFTYILIGIMLIYRFMVRKFMWIIINSYWISVVSIDMCEFYICLVAISLLIMIIEIGLHVS